MRSLYEEAEWVVLSSSSTPLSLSTVRVKNPGDGPRVLLIHGNPGTLDDFSSLIPHLSFASEVVAFDLPGFGKSPPPVHADTAFSLAGLAKVALSLADQLGWQRFDLIGHSHGAGVAQAMAWHSSQRIDRLLLLASLGYPAHAAYRQMAIPGVRLALSALAACLSLPGGRAWLKSMQRGIAGTAYYPEAVSPERLERDVDTMMSAPRILPTMARLALSKPCADLAAHAATIGVPTLFLHGSSDRLVPERHARAVHQLRVGAGRPSSFELLPEAGHMLPITHAEHVASRYREMMAST
jgi:pimeloyl-ACP methyl ester carboxylesterase